MSPDTGRQSANMLRPSLLRPRPVPSQVASAPSALSAEKWHAAGMKYCRLGVAMSKLVTRVIRVFFEMTESRLYPRSGKGFLKLPPGPKQVNKQWIRQLQVLSLVAVEQAGGYAVGRSAARAK